MPFESGRCTRCACRANPRACIRQPRNFREHRREIPARHSGRVQIVRELVISARSLSCRLVEGVRCPPLATRPTDAAIEELAGEVLRRGGPRRSYLLDRTCGYADLSMFQAVEGLPSLVRRDDS